jgi:tetratricopeptide (TPR) repeat protein
MMVRSLARALVLAWSALLGVGCASSPPLPARAVELNAAGARAIGEGQLEVAEARLAVALEYNPRFVEAWVNLGYVALARRRYDEARRDFARARDLNQDLPAPHHALGVLAEEEGRGEEAEAFYRAALKVDPGFAPARANLGRRLLARLRFDEAREQYARLVEVVPESVEGWVGEAEALRRIGREAEAEALVARARERFGDAPELRLLLAREAVERSDWREAEALLAPVAGGTDRPRASAAWAWIAVARIGAGDAAGASAAVRAALAIDRHDAVARYAERLLSRAAQ